MRPLRAEVTFNPLWTQGLPAELLRGVMELSYADLLAWLNRQSRDRGLVSGEGRGLHFVSHSALPEGSAYESWIAQTGAVPTRDNAHDRFNALMWLVFPKTKARLNQLQAAQIGVHGVAARRGPTRDAATLWDENLLVLACQGRAALMSDLLQAHDWSGLFIAHRESWYRDWTPIVFGHALLEKLQRPYKSVTAHCIVLNSPDCAWYEVDAQLCQRVTWDLHPGVLHPLPVMGIPGWHPENLGLDFYQDVSVFRPRAASQTT